MALLSYIIGAFYLGDAVSGENVKLEEGRSYVAATRGGQKPAD